MRVMTTSLYVREWRPEFFDKGIHNGDLNQEYETVKGRILCRTKDAPFPLGGPFLVVEFRKDSKQVFRDPDVRSEWSRNYGWYVNHIRASEIVAVHRVTCYCEHTGGVRCRGRVRCFNKSCQLIIRRADGSIW